MKSRIALALLVLVSLCVGASRRHALFSARAPTGAGAGFEPDDISGLLIWLAADDGCTNSTPASPPADGEGVVGWRDKAGTDNFFLSGAASPVYETGIQNGKPVVRFTAASLHYMSNTFGSVLNGADISKTVVVMASVVATNATSLFWNMRNSADTDSLWQSYINSAGRFGHFKRDDGAGSDTVLGSGPIAATFYNITWVISGTSCIIYTNNVQCVSDTLDVSTTTFDSTWIGRTGSTYMSADVGEILVYDSALSSGDRTSVYDYMKTRWGTP